MKLVSSAMRRKCSPSSLPCHAPSSIMLVLPGPGLLTGIIGAALLAGESRIVARWLDGIDLLAARVWARWRKRR